MSGIAVKGYQIIELIGRGASSEVFKARRIPSGQLVALKVVRRKDADSSRHFKQIANEFGAAREWNHPNLVRLHEIVTERLLFWKTQMALAMEFVPGEPLRSAHGLTVSDLVSYYMQIASGLHYMHQQGHIHLDMKPQNVIITPDKKAKIMDFGLCTLKGKYNPRVQGTPDFMAPEQMRKGWVDERTDIYNLGATMFYIVTGKSVQMTLTHRQHREGGASVSSETFHSLSVEVPHELESLILESCRSGPAERPATMERIMERLEAIRRKLPPQP
jgi:serine/threonine-protein kinase